MALSQEVQDTIERIGKMREDGEDKPHNPEVDELILLAAAAEKLG